jgi:hypothetical protein
MNKLLSRLFPGKTEPDFITIVSGLPRSGTSLMMNMLEAGGMKIVTDNLRSADTDNPGGYYEFERVKHIYKGDHAWLSEVRGKVVKVISTLLPFLPGNYRYRILFMQREMTEILASQKKMLINRGEEPGKSDDGEMAAIFEKNLRQVEEWSTTHPNVIRLNISYNELLRDPAPLVERINEFLGGKLETEAMLRVINPDLYRQRLAK